MKGLFVKELLNLRSYYKTILILLVFFLMIGVFLHTPDAVISMGSAILVALPLVMMLGSFSQDETSKWDLYALTMPLRRKNIVRVKYLFSLGIAGAFLVVLYPITLLAGQNPLEAAKAFLAVIAVLLVYLSIFFPLLFRFGVEKARYLISILALAPTLLMLGANHITLPDITVSGPGWLLLAAAVCGLLYGSYRLSLWFFAQKDL